MLAHAQSVMYCTDGLLVSRITQTGLVGLVHTETRIDMSS